MVSGVALSKAQSDAINGLGNDLPEATVSSTMADTMLIEAYVEKNEQVEHYITCSDSRTEAVFPDAFENGNTLLCSDIDAVWAKALGDDSNWYRLSKASIFSVSATPTTVTDITSSGNAGRFRMDDAFVGGKNYWSHGGYNAVWKANNNHVGGQNDMALRVQTKKQKYGILSLSMLSFRKGDFSASTASNTFDPIDGVSEKVTMDVKARNVLFVGNVKARNIIDVAWTPSFPASAVEVDENNDVSAQSASDAFANTNVASLTIPVIDDGTLSLKRAGGTYMGTKYNARLKLTVTDDTFTSNADHAADIASTMHGWKRAFLKGKDYSSTFTAYYGCNLGGDVSECGGLTTQLTALYAELNITSAQTMEGRGYIYANMSYACGTDGAKTCGFEMVVNPTVTETFKYAYDLSVLSSVEVLEGVKQIEFVPQSYVNSLMEVSGARTVSSPQGMTLKATYGCDSFT